MAADRMEEESTGDDGVDRTQLPSLWRMTVVVVAAMVMLSCVQSIQAAPTMTNDTMIVTQTSLYGPCLDDTGTEVGDGATWTTGCDLIECHVELNDNYTVTHGCRALVPSENPDTINCVTVPEDTAAAYPDCCPYLQCGAAGGLSTVNPSLCNDLQSNSTCQIWKDLSSNCTDTSSYVYNFTVVYCRDTCGFCSGGSG